MMPYTSGGELSMPFQWTSL